MPWFDIVLHMSWVRSKNRLELLPTHWGNYLDLVGAMFCSGKTAMLFAFGRKANERKRYKITPGTWFTSSWYYVYYTRVWIAEKAVLKKYLEQRQHVYIYIYHSSSSVVYQGECSSTHQGCLLSGSGSYPKLNIELEEIMKQYTPSIILFTENS